MTMPELSGKGYHGLTIRGDSLSCPLALGVDPYYNCEYRCSYCIFLSLCHTWGKDFRGLDLDWMGRTITSADLPKSERSKNPLTQALRKRKTVRFGNKFDPFQPIEEREGIAGEALRMLARFGFQLKIETKNPAALFKHLPHLKAARAIVTTTVLCGWEDDWKLLEGADVPSPTERLQALAKLGEEGLQVAAQTEPFIAGHHTPEDFRRTLKHLKAWGIRRTNLFNVRLNAFTLKNLAAVGLDPVKLWDGNQDVAWRKTLRELLSIGYAEGMTVGCPDWVNMGVFRQGANTCCGVDVENPCRFNQVTWREIGMERGAVAMSDLEETWDGVGGYGIGECSFLGNSGDAYSLGDTGEFRRVIGGWVRRKP